MRSSGRGKLPVCVVRKRSVLRIIHPNDLRSGAQTNIRSPDIE
jgi:hypothetical protein